MIKKILTFLFQNRRLIYGLFFLITISILALTLLPPENLGSNRLFQYDKVGHFMMFFSWTLVFGLLYISIKKEKSNLIIVFFAGAFFGIIVEILQVVLPFGRSLEFYDAIADILGTFSATFMLMLIKRNYLLKK
ncbi:VanZ family protein [Rhodohalobacter barkolensis]|uniref:VanZ-like domain-containing protein n=1 Tax=Rhodohalobacter barkolensis TaxID=2053187 RepID=A0A2N0VM81_9BACT|nr:VanZ family protein [Rhodohalobacter barkolensis]PKD45292.1 hypothetical protein CWD77_07580 [Rhodohalobacter barkolensis]